MIAALAVNQRHGLTRPYVEFQRVIAPIGVEISLRLTRQPARQAPGHSQLNKNVMMAVIG
jgi:hypothetical protein